jgi:DNA polymerase-3 subunit delta
MNALEWLRAPDARAIRPVCVVFGDDAYLIRESITAIARTVFPESDGDEAIVRFPGSSTPLANVLDELRTLPFFSRKRLVVVEDADPFISKHRKDLEAYTDKPAGSGILLLQAKTWVSTTKLAMILENVGLPINCSSPKEGDLVAWLGHMARVRFDVQLAAPEARLMVELIGPESGILMAELEKLTIYVAEARRIERNDILRLVGAGRVETIWKTLEAALAGHGPLALAHLDTLITAGEEPVGLLAAMSANLLKLHHAGHLRAARLNIDEACRLAGMPSFAVEKTRKQHAHLGPGRVDQLPRVLERADLDLKGGSTLDARTILETFLIWLALPRSD